MKLQEKDMGSFMEKFGTWLFQQGAALVVSLLFIVWYLAIDRPDLKNDLKECHERSEANRIFIQDKFLPALDRNTHQLEENDQLIRFYFDKLTQPPK